jgi:hypothetical protein
VPQLAGGLPKLHRFADVMLRHDLDRRVVVFALTLQDVAKPPALVGRKEAVL